jgi:GTP-binding protein
MKRKGTSTVLVDCAGAGDIVSVAGLSQPSIGHTVSAAEVNHGKLSFVFQFPC